MQRVQPEREKSRTVALTLIKLPFFPPSDRVESTDSLRSRIRDLETECKKLTMDMKLKEEQIRDLEGKCQVRRNDIIMGNQQWGGGFAPY